MIIIIRRREYVWCSIKQVKDFERTSMRL